MEHLLILILLLTVVLFGVTVKEWRKNNPNLKGNIRDNVDILHLVVLNNLEIINAEMIENGISQKNRLERLNHIARKLLNLLINDRNINYIENIDKISK